MMWQMQFMVNWLGRIGNYIPHVQEHNGHIPDSFSFQYDCRIFPVTKTTLLINIFISKVNSAGESCFTINNTDFTMITIILNDIQKRTKWIKNLALNAFFAKKAFIMIGKCCEASKTIINQADVNSFGCFSFKNIQNRSPHHAIIDNKIFDVDIMFCLLQFTNKHREHIISYLEIFSSCISVNRETGVLMNISGLDCRRLRGFLKTSGDIRILFHIGKAFLLNLCIFILDCLCNSGFTKKYIQHNS